MPIIVNGSLHTTLEDYRAANPSMSREEFIDAQYALQLHAAYACGNGNQLNVVLAKLEGGDSA